MTDETENLVLEHLRHIRAKVDRLDDHMVDVITRLGVIERNTANQQVSIAHNTGEIDVIKARLDQIEKRLELRES